MKRTDREGWLAGRWHCTTLAFPALLCTEGLCAALDVRASPLCLGARCHVRRGEAPTRHFTVP